MVIHGVGVHIKGFARNAALYLRGSPLPFLLVVRFQVQNNKAIGTSHGMYGSASVAVI
jgi:hypothetical protein